jgi:tetratricopeptide (TPR) repeat protein
MRLQVHFDLGVLHENAQEFDKAATAFTEVAGLLEKGEVPSPEQGGAGPEEVATQVAETYERLGRVCVRARRFDEAIAAYRKAQEKDPRRRQRLAYNLADVYVGQGKPGQALGCLDDYLRTQPQGTEAYELKVDLLRRLHRESEILPSLEAYARADAQNQALQVFLARQYAAAGKQREAETRYATLVRESPNPEVYRGLFSLYRAQGTAGVTQILALLEGSLRATEKDGPGAAPDDAAKIDAAVRARAMLAVLRDDADLVKALLPVVGQRLTSRQPLQHDTCRFLALLADRTHQLDDAERLYRNCLGITGQGRRSNEPEVYSGLLHVLWQEHKFEAVIEVCRQGLSEAGSTNLLLFHIDMSRALMRLGKVDEALVEATRAADIATDEDHRLQTRCYRATLLAQADRVDEAEAEGKALLKEFTGPGQVEEVRYTLSEIYSQAKKYPKAEEQLQQVLKDHPEEARAHNDLGYLWADRGKNLAEAEKLIRAALDLDRKQRQTGAKVDADADQDNAAYLDSLGWVLFKRGHEKEARVEMEKACRLPDGADDPVVWDHCGDVYHKLGETEKARAAWQKAIELFGAGGRRRSDERLKDIETKLRLLQPAAPGR